MNKIKIHFGSAQVFESEINDEDMIKFAKIMKDNRQTFVDFDGTIINLDNVTIVEYQSLKLVNKEHV